MSPAARDPSGLSPGTGNRDGSPCFWCGRAMDAAVPALRPTRDHVLAKSRGGGRGRNLVWACMACNRIKGDMSVAEWEAFRSLVPEWWAMWPTVGGRWMLALHGLEARVTKFASGG